MPSKFNISNTLRFGTFLSLPAHVSSISINPNPIPSLLLNDGNRMPVSGIGMCCRDSATGEAAKQSIIEYLNMGGRHIDTAILYNNHEMVGQGIKEWIGNQTALNQMSSFSSAESSSGSESEPSPEFGASFNLPIVTDPNYWRSQIFLTTKVWHKQFGFENVIRAVTKSMKELQVDYLDLVLLHTSGSTYAESDDPDCVTENVLGRSSGLSVSEYTILKSKSYSFSSNSLTTLDLESIQDKSVDVSGTGKRSWELCRASSWAALEYLKSKNVIRSIGVSNWDIPKLVELKGRAKYPPAVNQLEWHPWYWQKEMLDYSRENHLILTAYGSMGSRKLVTQIMEQPESESVFKKIALRYKGKTAGQILLRWAIQKNIIVIPGTGNPKHMRENLDVFDFQLTEDEMSFLDNMKEGNEMHLYGHTPDLIV